MRKDLISEPSDSVDSIDFSSDEIDLIMDVYNHYKQYSAIGLMNLSHDENGPWNKYFDENSIGGNIIPKEEIESYFKKVAEEAPIRCFSDFSIPENMIDDSCADLA